MTTKIQARIDESLKTEVESILAEIGVTTTELMRMTFRQVAMHRGIPFEVKIPNAETIAALEEDPKNFTTYPDVKTAMDDMWRDLTTNYSCFKCVLQTIPLVFGRISNDRKKEENRLTK